MSAPGELQNGIYLQGLAGVIPALPLEFDTLEAAAREVMTGQAWAYVAGGAGRETTMAANLAAFRRHQLVPRMLRRSHSPDLSVELLGTRLDVPVLAAPVGALALVRPQGEQAAAAGAADAGVTAVLSTLAEATLEETAAAAPGGRRWFQLYWPSDDEVAASLVGRAQAAGAEAIVVTLDTWRLGWRARDLALGHLPFLRGLGIANYLADPVFRSRLSAPPEQSEHAARQAILVWAAMFGNPDLGWADLARLREWTSLPVLVKGVCHPDDARAALDSGVDGIVVSNHGGRQVDGAAAALDCLPGVVSGVGGRVPVLFDSGIRSGADIAVALALGARAVLVGRPWVYGLALAGKEGVAHVLRILLADLDLTLALAGVRSVADLRPDMLVGP
jgi:isopentenyl diphosphate isomerase/L-lactate dehydrogenase-like FMN-dependent dehydrogenase